MNELYTVNYKDEGPFFLSNFGQITRCVRIHGVHNEEAIDRNTAAIIAQTEMQNRESDESQLQFFSGHSVMIKQESDQTQGLMSAHTKMQKQEFDDIENALEEGYRSVKDAVTAHTSAYRSENATNREKLQTEVKRIVDELEDIAGKIEANTTGDATNSNNITRAIQNLRLIVNP